MRLEEIHESLVSDTSLLMLLAIISMLVGILNGIKKNVDNNVSSKRYTFYYIIAEEAFISFFAVPLVFYVLITFADPYIAFLVKDVVQLKNEVSVLIYALVSLLFGRDLVKMKNYQGVFSLIVSIITKGKR